MNPAVMAEKMSQILTDAYDASRPPLPFENDLPEFVSFVFNHKNESIMKWLISYFLHASGVEDPVKYALSLTSNKSHDYAGEVDAMANFKVCARFGIKPSVGIVTRLSDKLSRIENLNRLGEDTRQVKDESVRDTLIDAANYTAILWLWLTEEELINFESQIGVKE